MVVFCEECGTRNVIDPTKIAVKKFRCKSCNDILRIYGLPSQPPTPNDSAQIEQKEIKPAIHMRMEIRFKDRVIEISPKQPLITIGRQEHNDIEVIDTRVSRSHARIEFRNGKFVLVDISTNGTYVLINEKQRQGVNVKKDELMLHGSGVLGLGRKVDLDSPDALHFSVKS